MARRNSKLKMMFIVIGLTVIIGAGSVYGVNTWYQNALGSVSHTVSEQQFSIELGTATEDIAADLYSAGLIRNANAYKWYVKSNEDKAPKAGAYRLSPHLTTEEVAEILAGGKVETKSVTVLPGKTLDEIAESLIGEGFSEVHVNAALQKNYSHKLFDTLPEGSSLEGYIFPETIQVTTDMTADEVLERYFDAFYDSLSSELLAGLKKQGLTLHEAIILASIVQMEVGDPEIQPIVAQLFLKRLDEGQVLGSDVTFIYAAKQLGVEPRVDLDSPYNTRIYGGLPPGPVSNFNISALQAVAFPADTEYLFFVSGDDGINYFSYTEQEHLQKVRAHCIELCKL